MNWPTTEALRLQAKLPEGYQFERFDRTHIPQLIESIKQWHPDISVGANSGYLREDYYLNRVCFQGGARSAGSSLIGLPTTRWLAMSSLVRAVCARSVGVDRVWASEAAQG
jgi:hypothetical protein